MTRFSFSADLPLPPDKVWQGLMDFPDPARWDLRAGGEAMAADGRIGTETPVAQASGPERMRLKVLSHRPPELFETEFARGQARGRSQYRLEAVDDGRTRLHHQLSLELSGADRILAFLLRPGLKRDFAALISFIERRDSRETSK